jgi:hypothetical protein
MPETQLTLTPPRQARVLGRGVGALRIKPDAEDPEAVVGVFNPETGRPETHQVRPGDEFSVAGLHVRITAISPPPTPQVTVTMRWPDDLKA